MEKITTETIRDFDFTQMTKEQSVMFVFKDTITLLLWNKVNELVDKINELESKK